MAVLAAHSLGASRKVEAVRPPLDPAPTVCPNWSASSRKSSSLGAWRHRERSRRGAEARVREEGLPRLRRTSATPAAAVQTFDAAYSPFLEAGLAGSVPPKIWPSSARRSPETTEPKAAETVTAAAALVSGGGALSELARELTAEAEAVEDEQRKVALRAAEVEIASLRARLLAVEKRRETDRKFAQSKLDREAKGWTIERDVGRKELKWLLDRSLFAEEQVRHAEADARAVAEERQRGENVASLQVVGLAAELAVCRAVRKAEESQPAVLRVLQATQMREAQERQLQELASIAQASLPKEQASVEAAENQLRCLQSASVSSPLPQPVPADEISVRRERLRQAAARRRAVRRSAPEMQQARAEVEKATREIREVTDQRLALEENVRRLEASLADASARLTARLAAQAHEHIEEDLTSMTALIDFIPAVDEAGGADADEVDAPETPRGPLLPPMLLPREEGSSADGGAEADEVHSPSTPGGPLLPAMLPPRVEGSSAGGGVEADDVHAPETPGRPLLPAILPQRGEGSPEDSQLDGTHTKPSSSVRQDKELEIRDAIDSVELEAAMPRVPAAVELPEDERCQQSEVDHQPHVASGGMREAELSSTIREFGTAVADPVEVEFAERENEARSRMQQNEASCQQKGANVVCLEPRGEGSCGTAADSKRESDESKNAEQPAIYHFEGARLTVGEEADRTGMKEEYQEAHEGHADQEMSREVQPNVDEEQQAAQYRLDQTEVKDAIESERELLPEPPKNVESESVKLKCREDEQRQDFEVRPTELEAQATDSSSVERNILELNHIEANDERVDSVGSHEESIEGKADEDSVRRRSEEARPKVDEEADRGHIKQERLEANEGHVNQNEIRKTELKGEEQQAVQERADQKTAATEEPIQMIRLEEALHTVKDATESERELPLEPHGNIEGESVKLKCKDEEQREDLEVRPIDMEARATNSTSVQRDILELNHIEANDERVDSVGSHEESNEGKADEDSVRRRFEEARPKVDEEADRGYIKQERLEANEGHANHMIRLEEPLNNMNDATESERELPLEPHGNVGDKLREEDLRKERVKEDTEERRAVEESGRCSFEERQRKVVEEPDPTQMTQKDHKELGNLNVSRKTQPSVGELQQVAQKRLGSRQDVVEETIAELPADTHSRSSKGFKEVFPTPPSTSHSARSTAPAVSEQALDETGDTRSSAPAARATAMSPTQSSSKSYSPTEDLSMFRPIGPTPDIAAILSAAEDPDKDQRANNQISESIVDDLLNSGFLCTQIPETCLSDVEVPQSREIESPDFAAQDQRANNQISESIVDHLLNSGFLFTQISETCISDVEVPPNREIESPDFAAQDFVTRAVISPPTFGSFSDVEVESSGSTVAARVDAAAMIGIGTVIADPILTESMISSRDFDVEQHTLQAADFKIQPVGIGGTPEGFSATDIQGSIVSEKVSLHDVVGQSALPHSAGAAGEAAANMQSASSQPSGKARSNSSGSVVHVGSPFSKGATSLVQGFLGEVTAAIADHCEDDLALSYSDLSCSARTAVEVSKHVADVALDVTDLSPGAGMATDIVVPAGTSSSKAIATAVVLGDQFDNHQGFKEESNGSSDDAIFVQDLVVALPHLGLDSISDVACSVISHSGKPSEQDTSGKDSTERCFDVNIVLDIAAYVPNIGSDSISDVACSLDSRIEEHANPDVSRKVSAGSSVDATILKDIVACVPEVHSDSIGNVASCSVLRNDSNTSSLEAKIARNLLPTDLDHAIVSDIARGGIAHIQQYGDQDTSQEDAQGSSLVANFVQDLIVRTPEVDSCAVSDVAGSVASHLQPDSYHNGSRNNSMGSSHAANVAQDIVIRFPEIDLGSISDVACSDLLQPEQFGGRDGFFNDVASNGISQADQHGELDVIGKESSPSSIDTSVIRNLITLAPEIESGCISDVACSAISLENQPADRGVCRKESSPSSLDTSVIRNFLCLAPEIESGSISDVACSVVSNEESCGGRDVIRKTSKTSDSVIIRNLIPNAPDMEFSPASDVACSLTSHGQHAEGETSHVYARGSSFETNLIQDLIARAPGASSGSVSDVACSVASHLEPNVDHDASRKDAREASADASVVKDFVARISEIDDGTISDVACSAASHVEKHASHGDRDILKKDSTSSSLDASLVRNLIQFAPETEAGSISDVACSVISHEDHHGDRNTSVKEATPSNLDANVARNLITPAAKVESGSAASNVISHADQHGDRDVCRKESTPSSFDTSVVRNLIRLAPEIKSGSNSDVACSVVSNETQYRGRDVSRNMSNSSSLDTSVVKNLLANAQDIDSNPISDVACSLTSQQYSDQDTSQGDVRSLSFDANFIKELVARTPEVDSVSDVACSVVSHLEPHSHLHASRQDPTGSSLDAKIDQEIGTVSINDVTCNAVAHAEGQSSQGQSVQGGSSAIPHAHAGHDALRNESSCSSLEPNVVRDLFTGIQDVDAASVSDVACSDFGLPAISPAANLDIEKDSDRDACNVISVVEQHHKHDVLRKDSTTSSFDAALVQDLMTFVPDLIPGSVSDIACSVSSQGEERDNLKPSRKYSTGSSLDDKLIRDFMRSVPEIDIRSISDVACSASTHVEHHGDDYHLAKTSMASGLGTSIVQDLKTLVPQIDHGPVSDVAYSVTSPSKQGSDNDTSRLAQHGDLNSPRTSSVGSSLDPNIVQDWMAHIPDINSASISDVACSELSGAALRCNQDSSKENSMGSSLEGKLVKDLISCAPEMESSSISVVARSDISHEKLHGNCAELTGSDIDARRVQDSKPRDTDNSNTSFNECAPFNTWVPHDTQANDSDAAREGSLAPSVVVNSLRGDQRGDRNDLKKGSTNSSFDKNILSDLIAHAPEMESGSISDVACSVISGADNHYHLDRSGKDSMASSFDGKLVRDLVSCVPEMDSGSVSVVARSDISQDDLQRSLKDSAGADVYAKHALDSTSKVTNNNGSFNECALFNTFVSHNMQANDSDAAREGSLAPSAADNDVNGKRFGQGGDQKNFQKGSTNSSLDKNAVNDLIAHLPELESGSISDVACSVISHDVQRSDGVVLRNESTGSSFQSNLVNDLLRRAPEFGSSSVSDVAHSTVPDSEQNDVNPVKGQDSISSSFDAKIVRDLVMLAPELESGSVSDILSSAVTQGEHHGSNDDSKKYSSDVNFDTHFVQDLVTLVPESGSRSISDVACSVASHAEQQGSNSVSKQRDGSSIEANVVHDPRRVLPGSAISNIASSSRQGQDKSRSSAEQGGSRESVDLAQEINVLSQQALISAEDLANEDGSGVSRPTSAISQNGVFLQNVTVPSAEKVVQDAVRITTQPVAPASSSASVVSMSRASSASMLLHYDVHACSPVPEELHDHRSPTPGAGFSSDALNHAATLTQTDVADAFNRGSEHETHSIHGNVSIMTNSSALQANIAGEIVPIAEGVLDSIQNKPFVESLASASSWENKANAAIFLGEVVGANIAEDTPPIRYDPPEESIASAGSPKNTSNARIFLGEAIRAHHAAGLTSDIWEQKMTSNGVVHGSEASAQRTLPDSVGSQVSVQHGAIAGNFLTEAMGAIPADGTLAEQISSSAVQVPESNRPYPVPESVISKGSTQNAAVANNFVVESVNGALRTKEGRPAEELILSRDSSHHAIEARDLLAETTQQIDATHIARHPFEESISSHDSSRHANEAGALTEETAKTVGAMALVRNPLEESISSFGSLHHSAEAHALLAESTQRVNAMSTARHPQEESISSHDSFGHATEARALLVESTQGLPPIQDARHQAEESVSSQDSCWSISDQLRDVMAVSTQRMHAIDITSHQREESISSYGSPCNSIQARELMAESTRKIDVAPPRPAPESVTSQGSYRNNMVAGVFVEESLHGASTGRPYVGVESVASQGSRKNAGLAQELVEEFGYSGSGADKYRPMPSAESIISHGSNSRAAMASELVEELLHSKEINPTEFSLGLPGSSHIEPVAPPYPKPSRQSSSHRRRPSIPVALSANKDKWESNAGTPPVEILLEPEQIAAAAVSVTERGERDSYSLVTAVGVSASASRPNEGSVITPQAETFAEPEQSAAAAAEELREENSLTEPEQFAVNAGSPLHLLAVDGAAPVELVTQSEQNTAATAEAEAAAVELGETAAITSAVAVLPEADKFSATSSQLCEATVVTPNAEILPEPEQLAAEMAEAALEAAVVLSAVSFQPQSEISPEPDQMVALEEAVELSSASSRLREPQRLTDAVAEAASEGSVSTPPAEILAEPHELAAMAAEAALMAAVELSVTERTAAQAQHQIKSEHTPEKTRLEECKLGSDKLQNMPSVAAEAALDTVVEAAARCLPSLPLEARAEVLQAMDLMAKDRVLKRMGENFHSYGLKMAAQIGVCSELLQKEPAPYDGNCDICGQEFDQSSIVVRCQSCSFDVCSRCELTKVWCAAGHLMTRTVIESLWKCSKCEARLEEGTNVLHCGQCALDVCSLCEPVQERLVIPPRVASVTTTPFAAHPIRTGVTEERAASAAALLTRPISEAAAVLARMEPAHRASVVEALVEAQRSHVAAANNLGFASPVETSDGALSPTHCATLADVEILSLLGVAAEENTTLGAVERQQTVSFSESSSIGDIVADLLSMNRLERLVAIAVMEDVQRSAVLAALSHTLSGPSSVADTFSEEMSMLASASLLSKAKTATEASSRERAAAIEARSPQDAAMVLATATQAERAATLAVTKNRVAVLQALEERARQGKDIPDLPTDSVFSVSMVEACAQQRSLAVAAAPIETAARILASLNPADRAATLAVMPSKKRDEALAELAFTQQQRQGAAFSEAAAQARANALGSLTFVDAVAALAAMNLAERVTTVAMLSSSVRAALVAVLSEPMPLLSTSATAQCLGVILEQPSVPHSLPPALDQATAAASNPVPPEPEASWQESMARLVELMKATSSLAKSADYASPSDCSASSTFRAALSCAAALIEPRSANVPAAVAIEAHRPRHDGCSALDKDERSLVLEETASIASQCADVLRALPADAGTGTNASASASHAVTPHSSPQRLRRADAATEQPELPWQQSLAKLAQLLENSSDENSASLQEALECTRAVLGSSPSPPSSGAAIAHSSPTPQAAAPHSMAPLPCEEVPSVGFPNSQFSMATLASLLDDVVTRAADGAESGRGAAVEALSSAQSRDVDAMARQLLMDMGIYDAPPRATTELPPASTKANSAEKVLGATVEADNAEILRGAAVEAFLSHGDGFQYDRQSQVTESCRQHESGSAASRGDASAIESLCKTALQRSEERGSQQQEWQRSLGMLVGLLNAADSGQEGSAEARQVLVYASALLSAREREEGRGSDEINELFSRPAGSGDASEVAAADSEEKFEYLHPRALSRIGETDRAVSRQAVSEMMDWEDDFGWDAATVVSTSFTDMDRRSLPSTRPCSARYPSRPGTGGRGARPPEPLARQLNAAGGTDLPTFARPHSAGVSERVPVPPPGGPRTRPATAQAYRPRIRASQSSDPTGATTSGLAALELRPPSTLQQRPGAPTPGNAEAQSIAVDREICPEFLQMRPASYDGFCDMCGAEFAEGYVALRCRTCRFDICGACNPESQALPKPLKKDELRKQAKRHILQAHQAGNLRSAFEAARPSTRAKAEWPFETFSNVESAESFSAAESAEFAGESVELPESVVGSTGSTAETP